MQMAGLWILPRQETSNRNALTLLLFRFKKLKYGEGGGRGDRDGEDMWTQGLFISMYDKIHYK